MKELMVVANVAIVFGMIYKIFELYVRRKERIMLIEKLGERLNTDIRHIFPTKFSFGGLRLGCLMIGLGIGLLVGYSIVYETNPEYRGYKISETISLIYGASMLLGGGIGLLISYVIEVNQRKIDKKRN